MLERGDQGTRYNTPSLDTSVHLARATVEFHTIAHRSLALLSIRLIHAIL